MTSPDLPPPVSLTLHEVDETDMVDAMIASLQINLPEWVPLEGSTEIMLMESLALVIGQHVYALNQLPRVVLDAVISIRGYQRKAGVGSSGVVSINLTASSLGTRDLPEGARFRIPLDSGGTFDALTVEALSFNPADSMTFAVNVTAEALGSEPNGVPAGTRAVMVDPYSWIESSVVTSAFSGGGDSEDDDEFYPRVAAAFQASSTTLVIDSQFATAALGVTGVGRARAFGLWDGVGLLGAVPGHLTVAIAGPDGGVVSPATSAAVLATLQASAVAGLTLHVIDFTRASMALVVTYSLSPGYSAATVSAAIGVALRAWLNPATWPYAETLTSVNQIILRLGAVAGVDNVTAISGWVSVTGGATLPSVTSVTATAV